MTNRINGDFDQTSIEAFRAAYATQFQKPEDQEIDEYTRLPTNVVSNTSPWIQHTGLWKANPGNLNDFVPNQILSLEEETNGEDISDEEIDNLVNELLGELYEEEDREEDIEGEAEDLLNLLMSADEDEDEELSEEDIDDIVNEFLAEDSEEDIDENELSEEDIDELIDSLHQEIEEAFANQDV